ncbi:unnamed protein product [Rotaria magnacalcarata]|uniref:Uncharacterized protein n=1 Tax=Rotaria magnacalcarata TaxID=392030 RepID=A0A8S3HY23_9BILA|nr:unnamed protein product [Rotaria magnacalcarata]
MSSFGTTMQGHCEYVHVKIEQPICKSTATNSKNKREYKLLFKPVQITNEEKIKLLTDLLDNVEEKFEKINYLTDRVEIYYECDEWTNVLKDIAEIESLGATKLSERLLTMKTEANIHMGISTVRRSIIDAVVNGGNTTLRYFLYY